MRTVGLREAKAKLSELVDIARDGEAVTITRHGEPEAVLVSFQDAKRLGLTPKKSFAELLLSFPGGIEFERDRSPIREIDL
jgi:prevent-host-death family protein